MTVETDRLLSDELDRRVEAFEAAWSGGGTPELEQFLPDRSSPHFAGILGELIRIELELRFARGQSPRLESYRRLAPHLFESSDWIRDLAFEEYRQRAAAGDAVDPESYAKRYRIDASDWPETVVSDETVFPVPGERAGTFTVIGELGRGSFARVYLAEQCDLAGRRVALKFTLRGRPTEPETLARLQHTHIVPVYSIHRHGRFQVIAMPYLGSTTLADVLRVLPSAEHRSWAHGLLVDTVRDREAGTRRDGQPDAPANRESEPVAVSLESARRRPFVESILRIGWKLAEALAHAHERGILHRDIKPANILLTNDGEPMLLDFNLAQRTGECEGFGGTPAYMAPEQLAAMRSGKHLATAQSDLFSLGRVLADFLIDSRDHTNRHPLVTPSTRAIVLKCLAARPEDRYASARELAEDLRRQLHDQPLAATREPSARERWNKWRRRHPVLASNGALAAVALAIGGLLVAGIVARQNRIDRLDAERAARVQYEDFLRDADRTAERIAVEGTAIGLPSLRDLLAHYGIPHRTDWDQDRAVVHLGDAARRTLFEQVGESLLLEARLEADRERALAINRRAEDAFAKTNSIPRTVWVDRYELAKALGRYAEAAEWHDRAQATLPGSRDWYLSGLAARDEGQWTEAEALLARAVADDPRHYWSWLVLGDVNTILGRDARAEGCFNACLALKPSIAAAYYNRGLCRTRMHRFDDAIADFSHVLELEPQRTAALIARGIATGAAGRLPEAERDFTTAIESSDRPNSRVLLLRSEIRRKRSDLAGATADRRAGLAATPTDAIGWETRALARAADGDGSGAIADLDEALKLQPRSYSVLMNRANVLDEKLQRPKDAIAALDRLVNAHPHALAPRAGRAVLRARLGQDADARADADYCLVRNPDAEVRYQLSGVFAWTSRAQPKDADRAFELLRSALADGYGHRWLADDPDLAPIRDREEFQSILEAARILKPSK